jgi:hypothetical protein
MPDDAEALLRLLGLRKSVRPSDKQRGPTNFKTVPSKS